MLQSAMKQLGGMCETEVRMTIPILKSAPTENQEYSIQWKRPGREGLGLPYGLLTL